MKFVYQTSINGTRQKEQAIVKQAAQKAGIDLELKSVTASVFFSSDVANPDTYGKFWADMQMYTTTMTAPDAERFMDQYKSGEISQKANKWLGRNICRWVNPEYDKLPPRRQSELDPVKRAAMYIKMNDMVVNDYIVVPLISRPRVRGGNLKLVTTLSGWDLDFSALQNWYRERAGEPCGAAAAGPAAREPAPAAAEPPMQDDVLRALVEDVRAGRAAAARLRRAAGRLRHRRRRVASMLLRAGDRAGPAAATVQADPARRRRPAEAAVLAGADAAEPALRHRHQGPGGLAPSSTSRWHAGTPTATSCRCWPPRSRAAPTAASRPTAGR